jgi:glycosyltransferase involved in cell wall biosynthesis
VNRPRLVHLATSDMTLALLLGPQLRAFSAAGYEVIGVSAPGRYVAELEDWGIEHRALQHATRAHAPGEDVRLLIELRRLFKELRPDIVHTHTPKPGYVGRLAARSSRVPTVVHTIHGIFALPEDPWKKKALVYTLDRIASAWSDMELVQNPEDLPVLRRLHFPERKLRVLGNGVDLTRFDPSRFDAARIAAIRAGLGFGPDDVVCGAVGRLVWEKGYREVFDAAAMLRARSPRVHFVIVGPVEQRDAVPQQELDRAAALGNVTFLGLRDDVEDLYAAMDLSVLASYREGFPRGAMEAAAMGLPLVLTDIRGCRQVVDDGVNGRLVPVRDARALADAIASLADDPEMRRRMGVESAAKAKREFDQQRVIDITLGAYDELRARDAVAKAR